MTALEKFCTEKELAELLKERTGYGCVRTLRKWRGQRTGPPWAKVGRVTLYPADGFDTWLASQVQQPARTRRAA